MKQRNQKHIALLSVVLVPALLLSACGSGASGQLSSSSTAPGSEPAVSVSQPEPEPQPAVTTLRFSATGDNLIHDGLYLQARSRAGGEGYDFTALYENVAPFYKDFDINWINQETLVTDELPPSSYPCFCTPGALGRAVYDVGWRVISMSNNHSYDKGSQGIAQRSVSGTTCRTTWSPRACTQAKRLRQHSHPGKGGRAHRLSGLYGDDERPPHAFDAAANVIYTSQEDVIRQQIELARQQADIVVVGVHWGVEGSHTPTDAQRALGQKIADWGADVIIGTHPHVIQPVELLTAAGTGKTVPIAYSLGNFVSTQAAANNMVGVILTFDITKTTQPDGSASASVGNVHAVPMVMHYDSNYTNARAYLYRDYTEELAAAHGVRARFSGFSKEYITQLLTEYISPEFLVLE